MTFVTPPTSCKVADEILHIVSTCWGLKPNPDLMFSRKSKGRKMDTYLRYKRYIRLEKATSNLLLLNIQDSKGRQEIFHFTRYSELLARV